jgi:hypothetical protein
MAIKKLGIKIIILLLGFFVLLYVLVNIYFIFIGPSGYASFPTDPCSKANNINEAVKCCDNYDKSQDEFTNQELKDHCYLERVQKHQCNRNDSSLYQIYRIKDTNEAQEELDFYRNICNKIDSEKLRLYCNEIIDNNLACHTGNVKYCKSDDYLCLGILGNRENECLKITTAHKAIDCLRGVIRANERVDKYICDLWQQQLSHLDQNLSNRSFYETEINWCYMNAGAKGKEIEACYNIEKGDRRREFCFQEARK